MTRLMVIAAVALLANVARAQEAVSLEVRAPADRCPDAEARFRDEVAARLEYIPFREDAARSVRLRVGTAGAELVGLLETSGGGVREFRSNDCEDLMTTMAAALAVELSPPSGVLSVREDARAPEPAAPPPPPAPDGRARVEVVSASPGLSLYAITGTERAVAYGSGGWAVGSAWHLERVCSAPCRTELEPNDYHFAVGEGTDEPVAVDDLVRIDGDTRLSLRYESYAGTRIAGFVTGLGGIVAGTALILSPLLALDDGQLEMGLFFVGLGVTTVSTLVGLILVATSDEAEVRAEPL